MELLSGTLLVAGGEVQTWQGGAQGAMEERCWGARLQLSRYSSFEGEALTGNHFHFSKFEFSLSVILRVLSVLEEGSHDLKVLAMLK